ncbi:MAG: hypothetical protein WD738_06120 [Pirellulales bacterium]
MRISTAAAKWPLVMVGVIGILICSVSVAVAGPMATTNLALFDGFGPDAGRWRGSAAIDVGPIFGSDLDTVVDWAAFAPVDGGAGTHKFQQYLNANHPGATIPAGSEDEVIYAYEVVTITSAVPGISTITVGVDAADARGDVGPTFVPLTGGQAPSGSSDQLTSMLWTYLPPPANLLTAGEKSPILVFSSPFAPQLDTMQVNSGIASPNPSPLVASISDRIFENEIPEPASLALVLFCGAIFAARRFRR